MVVDGFHSTHRLCFDDLLSLAAQYDVGVGKLHAGPGVYVNQQGQTKGDPYTVELSPSMERQPEGDSITTCLTSLPKFCRVRRVFLRSGRFTVLGNVEVVLSGGSHVALVGAGPQQTVLDG